MRSFLKVPGSARISIMAMIAALLTATTFLAATPAAAERVSEPTKPGTSGNEFIISCFRGPWKVVHWDRPAAIFIDELVEYGYTQTQALAIGERICREEYGVDRPEWMEAQLRRIVAETPPLHPSGKFVFSD
ncbi:MAG: hypothetical protein ABJ263_08395 [Tateyamaria sp.]|uniref:hypothetical protein n=1 Tax=Tateyamaria sp. TaxID=1929288 RepID=UPI00329059B7